MKSSRGATVPWRIDDIRVPHVGSTAHKPSVPSIVAVHPIYLNQGSRGKGLGRSERRGHASNVSGKLRAGCGCGGAASAERCPGIHVHITTCGVSDSRETKRS